MLGEACAFNKVGVICHRWLPDGNNKGDTLGHFIGFLDGNDIGAGIGE